MLDAYLHFVKKKNKRKYFDSNINEKPDKVFANKILWDAWEDNCTLDSNQGISWTKENFHK